MLPAPSKAVAAPFHHNQPAASALVKRPVLPVASALSGRLSARETQTAARMERDRAAPGATRPQALAACIAGNATSRAAAAAAAAGVLAPQESAQAGSIRAVPGQGWR